MTKCNACSVDVDPRHSHCLSCHRTFSTGEAFMIHTPGGTGHLSPEEMWRDGLVFDKGVWRMRRFSAVKSESSKQEKRLAKTFEGKPTPASGAMWHSKADVSTDEFLIEAKTTAHTSISVKRLWLDKVEGEAALVGKTPLVALSIAGRDYIVLVEDDFLSLLEERNVARARPVSEPGHGTVLPTEGEGDVPGVRRSGT